MFKFYLLKFISLDFCKISQFISLDFYEKQQFICLDNFDLLFLHSETKAIFNMYCKRLIDKYLSEWASRDIHKPLLLRGARQLGKSTAVQELSKKFDTFVEINFEKQPKYKALFKYD